MNTKLKLALVMIITALAFENAYAFLTMVPYKDTPKQTIELSLKNAHSDADPETEVRNIGQFGLGFMFENFMYEYSGFPLDVSGNGVVLTGHNLFLTTNEFQLIRQMPMEIQLGISNIDLTTDIFLEAAEETAVTKNYGLGYLKKLSATYKIRLGNNSPVNFYMSAFNTYKDEDETEYAYALTYETTFFNFFLEYGLENTFVGLEAKFNKRFTLTIEGLPADKRKPHDPQEDIFIPDFLMTLKIRNPIGWKPKEKVIIKPLKVDDNALEQMEKGLIAFYEQDYEASLANYLKVIKKYPNFPLIWNRLGGIYYQLDMERESRRAYKKVLEIDPEDETALVGLKLLDNKLRLDQLEKDDKLPKPKLELPD